MADDFDDLLDEALGGDRRDPERVRREAASNDRWEERVVKTIMTAGGLQGEYKELCYLRALKTDQHDKGVSFEMFRHRASRFFPLYVHCKRVPFLYKLDHAKIFKGLRQLTREWLKVNDNTPLDWGKGPTGLAIEWLHAGSPIKILHNHQLGRELPAGVQISWPTTLIDPKLEPELLTIESLNDYMLNSGWAKREPT